MNAAISEKKQIQLRHELKHIISEGDGLVAAARLQKLFPHDEHADSHGIYRVSSLYFDTPYDRALRQKIDGVSQREKFRIRYYGEDLTFIRLEKKIKTGGLCGKLSARLTKEEVQSILDGDPGFLLESGIPLLQEFYSKIRGQLLQPASIVTYEREAFLYAPGNVRITLDRRLQKGLNLMDFLKPDAWHLDMSEGLTVLEVKYDAFLPEVVRMAVQVPDRKSAAFSKYAVCRRMD